MAYEREAQTDIAALKALAAGLTPTTTTGGYEREAQSDLAALQRLSVGLLDPGAPAGYERVGQIDVAALRRKIASGGGGLATGYSLTGPSSGNVGVASTNFTVTLTPGGGTVVGTVIVTPSDSGGGGTFTPSTVSLTTASPSATFTYTAASSGAKTISCTNNGSLSNPGSLSYVASSGSTAHLLNTLISYWKLDEANLTRADSQGTNTLTTGNAPVGASGIINNGVQIIATNSQWLQAVSNASLQVTGDFTFSAWAKLASIIPVVVEIVISKDNTTAGQRDYSIFHHPTAGYVFSVADPNTIAVAVGTPASVGAWTHVVAWWSSADSLLRIRINDTTTYVSSMTGALSQSAANFYIGAVGNGSGSTGNFFDGIIDEIGFWKRLLTAAEITALYNGGAGLPFSSFTA